MPRRRTQPCPLPVLVVVVVLAVTLFLAAAGAATRTRGPPMLAGPARLVRRTAAFAPVVVARSSTRATRPFLVRMALTTSAAASVADNLAGIQARVAAAAKAAGRESAPPRLVAVSKTKPAVALQEAYDAGQRHFGENYVHEVLEKGPALPKDIRWHFIGHLQSNKAKPLVTQVPNLWMVESVDSAKLADRLNTAAAAVADKREGPLKVLIQVDTSGEETKSGVTAEEAVEIAQHVLAQCPQLAFAGVMTIGAPGDMGCFDRLVEARRLIATATGLEEGALELSMGMSGDFEEAIARGSTNVRVGSSIFGERDYSALKKKSPPASPSSKEGEAK